MEEGGAAVLKVSDREACAYYYCLPLAASHTSTPPPIRSPPLAGAAGRCVEFGPCIAGTVQHPLIPPSCPFIIHPQTPHEEPDEEADEEEQPKKKVRVGVACALPSVPSDSPLSLPPHIGRCWRRGQAQAQGACDPWACSRCLGILPLLFLHHTPLSNLSPVGLLLLARRCV